MTKRTIKIKELIKEQVDMGTFWLVELELVESEKKLNEALDLLIKLSNKPHFFYVDEVKEIAKLVHEAANGKNLCIRCGAPSELVDNIHCKKCQSETSETKTNH